jgi:hypothetical protein
MKRIEFTVGPNRIAVTDEMEHEYEDADLVITDPCYFIPDEVWRALCSEKVWFAKESEFGIRDRGTIHYNGVQILYSSTTHGDGSYSVVNCSDVIHKHFGVDSGMMCVVPLKFFESFGCKIERDLHALVEKFNGNIYVQGGNFAGDLEVWTDSPEEENYPDDSYEEDDYNYSDRWDSDRDSQNDWDSED